MPMLHLGFVVLKVHLQMLAPALRACLSSSDNQLKHFADVSESALLAAVDASVESLKRELLRVHREVKDVAHTKHKLEEKLKDGLDKYSIRKMATGSIDDFHKGLSDRIGKKTSAFIPVNFLIWIHRTRAGLASLDFFNAMRMEHMTRGGSDFVFVSGNYKLQTKACDEWLYVVGDENGRRVTPPASVMEHGRVIHPIDELLLKPLAKAAKLTREEMIAIVMYTGPCFVLYNAVLRRFPADIYNVFKDGDNLFSTTVFVLVSAVNKLSRCMNIPPGTLLYRGLGGTLEFPDRFTRADPDCATPNALGFLEFGFMSTTADKSVAVQYSGVKEGKPRAGILQISPNSVDRGADISLFSQYPAEREYLFVPYSFIQGEGRQRTEVVTGGGVLTVVPVRVNINLKTETTEELKEKKKRLHLVSARAMVEEVRYELGEWAKSAEAEARLQRDPTRNQTDSGFWKGRTCTASTLAAAIFEQFSAILKRHEATDVKDYVDDGVFRALVCEILDAKAWAKEKKEVWMQDSSQFICILQSWSLRECHRHWGLFLRKRIGHAASGSSGRAAASLELLMSRGLVKRSARGETNADGEDLLVQAGSDGWASMDIQAAVAAGADVDAADGIGRNCVWNASQYGHAECIAALLAVGGVQKCDDRGRSPIYIAARNGRIDCLSLLISAGGDVNKCTNDGWSPICAATSNGYADCLSLLISAGGDVNKCNYEGWSPICAAAEYNQAECLSLLVSAGGDINKCTDDGKSPIFYAAREGHADCISKLVLFGGDVNKCHNDGTSPICIAAQNGHADCLKILLASRADPRSSFKGVSALGIARHSNHTECVRALEAALS
jgi:ankyrin repeat protein